MAPEKKKKTNINTPRQTATPEVRPAAVAVNQARLAVGSLLGFYRRIRHKSQQQIAASAGLPTSAVAMFEAGQRLPSAEAIEKIARALGMDVFQQQQLQFISTYSGHASAIGEQWFMPDDVLNGTPVFLRNVHHEAEFQRRSSISEMWIVTSRPLALQGEMYEMLKQRLLSDETNFVYFLDSAAGESPFHALWSRLAVDAPGLNKKIMDKLRCVLTPRSFCLFHYGICNPGQLARMFGRLIIYAGGLPVGFLSMDSQQVSRAYDLLSPIYERCKSKPNEPITTEYGDFRFLQPSLPNS